MKVTRKNWQQLTDEQFAALDLNEMKKAMLYRAQARLQEMAENEPERLLELAAHFK
jgi:hypothetical protein